MASQCYWGHNAVDLSRIKLLLRGKQWLDMACVLRNFTVKDFHEKTACYLLETYIHMPKVFVMAFICRGIVGSQGSLT